MYAFTALAFLLTAPLLATAVPFDLATDYDHAAMLVFDKAAKSSHDLEDTTIGDPSPNQYINFYSIDPLDQTLNYCKINVSDTPPYTQYVYQYNLYEQFQYNGPASVNVSKPFDGRMMGRNCTYDGGKGKWGTLKCALSMMSHPDGVACIAPSETMLKNPGQCGGGTSNGGSDYQAVAYCPWKGP